MVLDISPESEALIQKAIDSGRYQNADEVLVEAITLLVDHDRESDEVSRSTRGNVEEPKRDEGLGFNE